MAWRAEGGLAPCPAWANPKLAARPTARPPLPTAPRRHAAGADPSPRPPAPQGCARRAVIAQLVARRSHNPKVVSSILTHRITSKTARCCFLGKGGQEAGPCARPWLLASATCARAIPGRPDGSSNVKLPRRRAWPNLSVGGMAQRQRV